MTLFKVDRTDKSKSLDSSNFMSQQQKPLPPKGIVPLPVDPPTKNVMSTPIVSGTKSLPSRNISLKQLPIPSNMLVPDVITPKHSSASARPPNVRSMSAHQSMNGRPISFQQQQQQQQPPLPSNSLYLQQQQNLSVSSPNLATKKPSFMRSVMAAVSSPRSSFRQSKINTKQSLESEGDHPSLRSPRSKQSLQNMSTVSLDQQIPTDYSASLRRYSAANVAEPAVPPQHLGIPPPQSPFGPRSSFINNQSTPSFISSANSSSQSSLALTPPLSRSSSPGSMTPVIVNRYATPSSSSSEDLGSPPESVSSLFFNTSHRLNFFYYFSLIFLHKQIQSNMSYTPTTKLKYFTGKMNLGMQLRKIVF